MTSKLALYNGALVHIGQRELAASEVNTSSRALDSVWDNGAIRACLEEGLWNFAMRGAQIDADPGIEPDFGFMKGFEKPTDWVRTASFCSDPYFQCALLRYTDEGGIWYCDIDPIYVRYVSSLDNYGSDLSLWPESFSRYVEAYLAHRIAYRLTQDDKVQARADALMVKLLADARAKDAMNEPQQTLPMGSWSSARGGRWYNRDNPGGLRGPFG